MKNVKFSLSVLLFSFIAVQLLVACSSDENDVSTPPTLDVPKYESNSTLFVMEANEEGIQSIELTASGNFLVVGTFYGKTNSVKKRGEASMVSFGTIPNAMRNTRSPGGYVFGKFIKISDTEFILEGFGTIVIEGASSNAVNVWVTPATGEGYSLTGKRENNYGDTPYTNYLCRTWDILTIRYQMKFNGKVIFDSTKSGSEFPLLMKEMGKVLSQFGDEEDDEIVFDDNYVGLSQVIFTKAGTYLIITVDDEVGYSLWKWNNEKKGIIRYTHDVWNQDFYDEDYSNDVTVSFSGNEMLIEETSLDIEEDGQHLIIKCWNRCVYPQ